MASPTPDWLLGEWISDPNDQLSLREYGSASINFRPDGELVYSVVLAGRSQKTVLQYRVERNTIFTNQSSAPAEEQTTFNQLPDGKLRLTFAGRTSTYVRAS